MRNGLVLVVFLFSLWGCSTSKKEEVGMANATTANEYFPPNNNTVWESKSVNALGWDSNAIADLKNFLEIKNTKAFIIIVDGKIVIEEYFDNHTANSLWYWASAGKTLTATLTGIAQQEGLIAINNKVATYLGTGWSSCASDKENLITCRHLLTMTSGLDDSSDVVTPDHLVYKTDAGTRWAYHNVYVKLQDVIARASGKSWDNYFNEKLKQKIGMDGTWQQINENVVYWSTARSMARFGLLALHYGKWNGVQVVDASFCRNATTESQNINNAYGYLWWLNGKKSYMLPQSQQVFNGSLIPNAPTDMFMALGKNDQKIYVVPSQKMVVVRMGDAADQLNMALSSFDNDLWLKIKKVYEK